tara:strand:- start:3 stop:317 length:315 start_codon:yes stop_codon:yes gene_type:complete
MKKKIMQKVAVISDVICDICQNSVINDFENVLGQSGRKFKPRAIAAQFGYGSNKDGQKFNFDFCEQCFDKLLSQIDEMKKLYRQMKCILKSLILDSTNNCNTRS